MSDDGPKDPDQKPPARAPSGEDTGKTENSPKDQSKSSGEKTKKEGVPTEAKPQAEASQTDSSPEEEQHPPTPPAQEEPVANAEEPKLAEPSPETAAGDQPATADSAPEKQPLDILNKIFLIHGRKPELLKACLAALEILHIEPVDLTDTDGSPENLEERVNRHPGIRFVIALLSGDEFVYSKTGKPADALLYADQSCVFSLGYMAGRFGKLNVFALYHEQKSFRLPTALNDMSYVSLDKHGFWKATLIRRIEMCGFEIPRQT